MDLESDRYLPYLIIIDVEILCPSRRAGSLSHRAAASWVFQKRARSDFPRDWRSSEAHRRVIKDRIGGTPAERGRGNGSANSCACARAYTLVEYLIGRNNYRRAVVYTGPYSITGSYTYVDTYICDPGPIISRARSAGPRNNRFCMRAREYPE